MFIELNTCLKMQKTIVKYENEWNKYIFTVLFNKKCIQLQFLNAVSVQ